MASGLLDHNLTGAIPTIKESNHLQPTKDNFITLMDYAKQWQPELVKELVMRNGTGSIQQVLAYISGGKEFSFESDIVQHAEAGRLHNRLLGVTIAGNVFTSTSKHNLRPNEVIKISNGTIETQAIVKTVTSDTVFTALNDQGTNFTAFDGPVTVLADFSNRFNKGDEGFKKGKRFDLETYQNYPHIMKELYDIADSDLAQISWVQTPAGPKWMNFEMERINLLHDNKVEITALFNQRALDTASSTLDGFAQGMKGGIQQIEERGNIANDYITTKAQLDAIAKRIKIEGQGCVEVTVWCDHEQMAKASDLAASMNASMVNGTHYGTFNNSKDMAISLDFTSIHTSGVTFHFKSWLLLDDPTLLGAGGFNTTSLAYLIIPTGMKNVTIGGENTKVPFFRIMYRKSDKVNRRRQVKLFGAFGTPQLIDRSCTEILTEMTCQVAGANAFYVGRRSEFYV